jgi:hypothetical protein
VTSNLTAMQRAHRAANRQAEGILPTTQWRQAAAALQAVGDDEAAAAAYLMYTLEHELLPEQLREAA